MDINTWFRKRVQQEFEGQPLLKKESLLTLVEEYENPQLDWISARHKLDTCLERSGIPEPTDRNNVIRGCEYILGVTFTGKEPDSLKSALMTAKTPPSVKGCATILKTFEYVGDFMLREG